MEKTMAFNKELVPSTIEIFYGPEQIVDEIDDGHREFCLELLEDMGFRCLSGAAGVGGHENFTVRDLTGDARDESIVVAGSERPNGFFAGPNPVIPNGIGIWTAA